MYTCNLKGQLLKSRGNYSKVACEMKNVFHSKIKQYYPLQEHYQQIHVKILETTFYFVEIYFRYLIL